MMVPFFSRKGVVIGLARKSFRGWYRQISWIIDRYRRESLRWLAYTVCNVITNLWIKLLDFLSQKEKE